MANKKDFTSKKVDPVRAAVTQGATNTPDTKDTSSTSDTPTEYRFSARFTPAQWSFIQEMKWQTRRSITAILQDYVEEDMKKHPEIIKKIDELNG